VTRFPARGSKGSRKRSSSLPPERQKYNPQAPMADADAVWSAVERILTENKKPDSGDQENNSNSKTRKRGADRKRRRRHRLVAALDVVGAVIWLAILLKLFVVDWDRLLVYAFIPDAVFLLDIRWYLPLALLALVLILFGASRTGVAIAYVMAFPIVVVLWKLPRLLIKYRSPVVVFGALSIGTAVYTRTRRVVISLAAALLSAFMVLLGDSPTLIITGMGGLFLVSMWNIYSTAKSMLKVPEFIRAQQKGIQAVLDHDILDRLIVPTQPDQKALAGWGKDEAEAYQTSAGNALLARWSLLWLSSALASFGRGPSAVLSTSLSTLWLIVQTVAAFTVIHYGAFLVTADSFDYIRVPNAWTFIYYSFCALYFGEVAALAPIAGLALVCKIANGFIGVVVLGAVVFTIVAPNGKQRSEAAANNVTVLLSGKVRDLDMLSEQQYQMSIPELEGRLLSTDWKAASFLNWIKRRAQSED
jgi:hypothetical protein